MMVRREVFEDIGYFDEDLFYGCADWDLCKRAADAGWASYYVHSARAIHYERQSFGGEGDIPNEVRYKVDGWHSAAWQYSDRYVFLRKYNGPAVTYGVKTINTVENGLRLLLILGSSMFGNTRLEDASFQIGACVQTIRAILKA
jgi:GT2 family glycosyltransferase